MGILIKDKFVAWERECNELADRRIEINLDDGVKKNYELFANILAKI